jgi:predicted transcriptional regulator of viral defense system
LLASEGDRIFSIDRARKVGRAVGLTDSYLPEALYHLRRTGWIVPVHRGLYAIASSVPGVSPTHEFEIAMALVQPAAISHWSALHHHGLTDQVPRKVFVLTTTAATVPRLRGVKGRQAGSGHLVQGALYQFIRVKPERFFGVEKTWVGEARVVITDPERTLIDGLTAPQYCGDIAEVLHAFEVRRPRLDLTRIIGYALRLDEATAKRLGWVLEKQGVDPAQLEPLRQLRVKSYRYLDASGPLKGPYNRYWMIRENLPGKVGR